MTGIRPYTGYVSTRWYRPPELILGTTEYGQSWDIFACGIVFAEFYSLIPVFWGKNSADQLLKYISILGSEDLYEWEEGLELWSKQNIVIPKIKSNKLGDFIPGASLESIDIMSKMLSLNPYFRPTIDEILEHPFFQEDQSK